MNSYSALEILHVVIVTLPPDSTQPFSCIQCFSLVEAHFLKVSISGGKKVFTLGHELYALVNPNPIVQVSYLG